MNRRFKKFVCSFFLTKKNQKVKAGIAELKNVPSGENV